MGKVTCKDAHMVFPSGKVELAAIHMRMSDCSSRLVRVGAKPSGKFLNGLVGQTDEELHKRFGSSFQGWKRRKPQ